jgi:2-keto-4-pentenoate hydratase/2-oxohepta-3-ene-1,7-dioic acid hydratase in catechol pathway
MKLVLFNPDPAGDPKQIKFGILTNDSVVDAQPAVEHFRAGSPQQLMEFIIGEFESLRPDLEHLIDAGRDIPISDVKLLPPLPRPGKILCCIGNYWEHMQREPRELNMFLKNPDAVIGQGGTVVLPRNTSPYVFQHEAELAIVIKGPAKGLDESNYATGIFGYTCLVDVSARVQGRSTWRSGSWMGKSFDTFAPLGPCIVTADEIPDPNALAVKFWNNGDLRHDYTTEDMEHRVPELIAFATSIMTLYSGDLISCGTNHEGLGPLQDGEVGEIQIQGIGSLSFKVADPLKRSWERGIYMGPNSTAPAARELADNK